MDDIQTSLLAIADENSPDKQLAKVQEIAARRARPRHRKKPTSDGSESSSSLTEVERLRAELAKAVERQRELEEEHKTARAKASGTLAVDGPVGAPADADIPAFLDRRSLGSEDQLKFDTVLSAWADSTELLTASVEAPDVVRERFVWRLRADIASASSHAG